MKRVGIVQSNYIPWKGYFDLIKSSDEFILLDDAQYTRRDWRNRNIIKTQQGPQWLTIPVEVKGNYYQKIKETKVVDVKWGEKHWKALSTNYGKAQHFSALAPIFEELYLAESPKFLSQINYQFISCICRLLGVETQLSWSMDYVCVGEGPTEKLVSLCQQVGATEYISGPRARDYLEVEQFHKVGIKVSFFDYSGYPEYRQLFGHFIHEVTILDLLFNEGPRAKHFLKTKSLSKGRDQLGDEVLALSEQGPMSQD